MKKTILVVDDSFSIRESIAFFLIESGFNVVKAEDGQAGLNQLNGQSIDLILSDLHMPVMDGIEMITNIRKKEGYKRVPILLLTTETLSEKKLAAKRAGATGWINKPFQKDKLMKVIAKVLR